MSDTTLPAGATMSAEGGKERETASTSSSLSAASASSSSAASPASPSSSLPNGMPLSMYFTSLDWMTTQQGVPKLQTETPPTSPLKLRRRASGGGGAAGPASPLQAIAAAAEESEEQRRARQEAIVRQKNEELQQMTEKKEKEGGDADSDSGLPDSSGSMSLSQLGLSTPPRKAAPSTAEMAAELLVSPEKRRAKKLSSLHYPIFAVYWWDAPLLAARQKLQLSAEQQQQQPDSLGLVLLAGGGGKKGAGIDSGMLVCSVLPSSAPIFSLSSSPIRLSTLSSKRLALNPLSFLDSNDFLIGHLTPHPEQPLLAAAVGAGTAMLEATGDKHNPTFHYTDTVQTDFSKDLSAQAQAWSPSGRWFVTGGEDKVIRAWRYPSLQLLSVFGGDEEGNVSPLDQHKNGVLTLHVNHDGTRVASCAGDAFMKVWNTEELENKIRQEEEEEQQEEEELKQDKEEEDKKQSKLLICPLLQNLTLPAVKGSVLKFQGAKFYGKKPHALSQQPSSPSGGQKKAEKASSSPKDDGEEYLLGIASQIRRGGGGSSTLMKYRCSDWKLLKKATVGSAPLTAMELSDDLHRPYVALSNTDGQVAVYDSLKMKCVKRVQRCHESEHKHTQRHSGQNGREIAARSSQGLPTTSLAFSPSSLFHPSSPSSSLSSSRWLLSASADKSVALIELPSLSGRSSRTLVFFVFAALLLLVALLLGKDPWILPESDL